MPNNLGLQEVVMADLGDGDNAINKDTYWSNKKVVRVVDHPSDVSAEQDDPYKMAIFERKSQMHPWMRRGTHLGSTKQTPTVGGGSDVEVIFPSTPKAISADNRIVLGLGQSIMRGTMNPAVNPLPAQPELPSNFKLFNGVGSTGPGAAAVLPANITSLRPYSEVSTENYYTPMTSFFDRIKGTGDVLSLMVAIGGTNLPALDQGGSSNSYSNLTTMLNAAKILLPDAKVPYANFVHGGANWQDTWTVYKGKVDSYFTNVVNAVKAQYPGETPLFIIGQHGGEHVTADVIEAQVKLWQDGHAMTSGTYWLHRQHPNEHPNNPTPSTSVERQHLNVTGSRYLGDMLARAAEGAEPIVPTKFSWLSKRKIAIQCNLPQGAQLVIDPDQPSIPNFPGRGIQMRKANGHVHPADIVTVSGDTIQATFPVDVEVDDRIEVGMSPRDLSYFDDNPSSAQSTLMGTNIRADYQVPGPLGLPAYYDWLACNRHIMAKEDDGLPADYTRGSNLWWETSADNTAGFGSEFSWDGTTETKVRDGVTTTRPTNNFVTGTSTPKLLFALEQGAQYEIICEDATVDKEARVTAGRYARLNIPAGNAGRISGIITVDGDETQRGISLRVMDTTILGRVAGISIRRVL